MPIAYSKSTDPFCNKELSDKLENKMIDSPDQPRSLPPWKIIIADDEKEVHDVTKMVLSDYTFNGRGIDFFSTFSMEETIQLLEKDDDFAIILLDVVMEEDDSGLKLVKYIRNEIKNNFIRIILRTGQPGKAPEGAVIAKYDINDYKEKSELTVQKLFTAITTSLRSYNDLKIIDRNRKGLEQIITASEQLYEVQSLKKFATGVLTQLLAILGTDEDSLFVRHTVFASGIKNNLIVQAATGKFHEFVDKEVNGVLPDVIIDRLNQAVEAKTDMFIEDAYIGYFHTKNRSRNLIYMTGCRDFTELDRNLIKIFISNVAIAFDNVSMSQQVVEAQNDIIITLGEIIETRSTETANHVLRVAVFSYLLAKKAGLSKEEAELLKLASPMHDIGKIGIPDAILHKPAKLTVDEYDAIKLHPGIGHSILKNSDREVMKAAAVIALQHHERWDGYGYPANLSGEDIHIFGRITAIADVFDALSHKRVYKDAWDMTHVLDLFRDEQGKTFDPELTGILLENADEFIHINTEYPEHCDMLSKPIW